MRPREAVLDSFDLSPPDAVWAGKSKAERCWNCAFYSFKTYGGEDSTSGKCFRYRDGGKVFYVDGLMWCPAFKSDEANDRGDYQP